MYYYGARYYDPRLSIFISVDPLAEKTMEPYSYMGNNPINMVDPTGMSKEGGEHDCKLYKNGEIKLIRYTADEFDRIFNYDESEYISVSSLFLGFKRENDTGKDVVYTLFDSDIRSGKGRLIFEFLANNSEVEFGITEYKNSKTNTFFGEIRTSHSSKKLSNIFFDIDKVLENKDLSVRYNSHSHPQLYDEEYYHHPAWPSGFNPPKELNSDKFTPTIRNKTPFGDRGIYKKLKKKFGNRIPEYFDLLYS